MPTKPTHYKSKPDNTKNRQLQVSMNYDNKIHYMN